MNRWRVVLLVLVILIVPWLAAPSAFAGPNEGGTLILHRNPSIAYTADQDYCAQSGLSSCAAAVVTAPADPDSTVVFYVLAAFPEGGSPRLKALVFGIEYDPERLVLTDHGTCAGFELPGNGWPASGTGTALVLDEVSTAPLAPLYWFAASAYSVGDTTSFALIPDPLHGREIADDSVPAVLDSIAEYGRLGFGTGGYLPCPGGGDQAGGEEEGDDGGDAPQGGESEPEIDGGGYELPAGDALAFIELVPATDSTFTQNLRGLEADYGLRILVAIIPDIVICQASDDQLQQLASDQRVTMATKSPVSGAPTVATNTIEPGQPGLGPTIWNYLLNPAQPETTSYSLPYACIQAPDSSRGDIVPERDQNRQTSVFMMGKVGVSLVFLESQDSRPCSAPEYTENWTLNERTQVLAEATQGLASQVSGSPGLQYMEPRAQLSFEIYDFDIAPTSVEPIRGVHNSETWGREALAYMGYGSGDLETRAYALNNARRRSWATDWWYTALVVRDVCDTDGAFSDGYSAYAWDYYGPHVVVTTRNGGYGLNNLDYVFAHETCHVFGADDEYASSGCGQHCSDRYGYLHVSTDNCAGCTSQQEPCIMNSMVRPYRLCPSSQGQLGWRDSEAQPDGVFDPIEQPTAHRSMRFQATTVYAGDYMDIRTEAGDWVKRVALSSWDADRGGALWDGFNYAGWECAPGTYLWPKNGGGSWRYDYLLPEQHAPYLFDVSVQDGPPPKLRFEFADDDTYCGRVRATVKRLGRPDKYAIGDKFYIDTYGSWPPIEVPLDLSDGQGLYTIEVRVWDSGGGREDVETIQYAYGGAAGIEDQPSVLGPAGPGAPNPSSGPVRWRIPAGGEPVTGLGIFAVDGRLVRRFAAEAPKAGTWSVLWDGRDESGRSVPSGRYYLRADSASGARSVGEVTISR